MVRIPNTVLTPLPVLAADADAAQTTDNPRVNIMADMLFPRSDRRSTAAGYGSGFGASMPHGSQNRGTSAPNVVALPHAGITVPAVIGDVMAYWGSLRAAAGGDVPTRTSVDPKAISAHLGQVFIASLTTPRVARLRIVGAGISDLMGLDPRGMVLGALFAAPARDEVTAALAQVAAGARVILPLRAEAAPGQPNLTAVMALMPLRGADGQVSQVLGVIGVNGTVGPFARKLTLASARIAANPPLPQPATALPATVTPATATPAALPKPGAPQLLLIHGGKA